MQFLLLAILAEITLTTERTGGGGEAGALYYITLSL
jgi:hypothetical protein